MISAFVSGRDPDFIAIEFSNVLTTGVRRSRLTPTEASGHLQDFQAIGLELRPFPRGDDLQHVLDVAGRTELSFYDAIYLVLAQQEGALLAIFDREIKAKAENEGVELYLFLRIVRADTWDSSRWEWGPWFSFARL